MQHLTDNLLWRPELVEEPSPFLDSDYIGTCDSYGTMIYDNQGLLSDELQTRVPGLNLLNEVLPFLWNQVSFFRHLLLSINELRMEIKDMTHNEGAVISEHELCSTNSPPNIEAPELSERSMSISAPPSEEQRNLDTESQSGIDCKQITPRQKIAHSQSEKRYRQNLDAKFLQLGDVVDQCHDEKTKPGSRASKRLQRVKTLEMARLHILELQEEVTSLKRKLRVLREATMPETCRFTIDDEIIGVEGF
jgi:hypothetical protein